MSLSGIPVHVTKDTTLRVKVLDTCGLTCTFCHNEGNPVTADNRGRSPGDYLAAGPSGRVSIYAASNGAAFLPVPIPADVTFGRALSSLCDALGFTEVHLTGGEPTLHPAVSQLTRIAVRAGLRVAMTSNGENGAKVLGACATEGMHRVNFSIFGTTSAELAKTQHARTVALAERKIEAFACAGQTDPPDAATAYLLRVLVQ
jgi:molybdenum cofactor biosynthesis enzyme MoaA